MTADAQVIVVGAGPTGLMLAAELGLAGIRTLVLDQLPGPSQELKANGLLGQVVRTVDRRGLYERLADADGPPRPVPAATLAALVLDLTLLDESPVLALPVPQPRLVQVLAERAVELGAEIRWGYEVVDVTPDDAGVTLDAVGPGGCPTSRGGRTRHRLRAAWVVGADGAHSAVRTLCGIGFPGVSTDRTTTSWAAVTLPEGWLDPTTGSLAVPGHEPLPPFVGRRTRHGAVTYAPLPGRPPMLVTSEWDRPAPEHPMSLAELRASLARVLGVDVPVGPPAGDGPHVLRRLVGGRNRQAERFRQGRVLLVGDAAHVDSAGGQGLNLGLQDAVNLGWKLAATLHGTAPPGLLDSYDSERRRAAERAALQAQAQSALLAPGDDVTALRTLVGELLTDRPAVRRAADLIAGTDVRYDMGESAHPWVGRAAPELTLETADGTVRLAELTRTARPLLLDLGTEPGLDGAVRARPTTPVAATAALLRPDGYVAWATAAPYPDAADGEALDSAVARWCPRRSGPSG